MQRSICSDTNAQTVDKAPSCEGAFLVLGVCFAIC